MESANWLGRRQTGPVPASIFVVLTFFYKSFQKQEFWCQSDLRFADFRIIYLSLFYRASACASAILLYYFDYHLPLSIGNPIFMAIKLG